MLWPNSLATTGEMHEKLRSFCFFTITNRQITLSTHCVMLQLSAWWSGLWIALGLEVVSFAAARTGVMQHSPSQATVQEVALLGYRPLCFGQVNAPSKHKNNLIYTTQAERSVYQNKVTVPPALLPFEGQVTEQTTVKKGSIVIHIQIKIINLTKMNIFWNCTFQCLVVFKKLDHVLD